MSVENLNVVVKVTTSCPAHCLCCVHRKEAMQSKNEYAAVFDLGIFDDICSRTAELGGKYIVLSGGEPTILRNLHMYMEIASKHGLRTRLNTNGWNVTEENLKRWLEAGLEEVVLSVYSLNKETLRKIRGSDSLLDRNVAAGRALGKLKSENNNDFKYIVQCVVMNKNYMELPDILRFAIDTRADYMWPSYMEDAINLPEIRMTESDIVDYRKRVAPVLLDIVEKMDVDNTIKQHNLIALGNYYKNHFEGYIYHPEEDFCCDWQGRHITFYPNGTIYPCPAQEYFKSIYEKKSSYTELDASFTEKMLISNKGNKLEQCKYCPQGLFQDLKLQ